MIGLLWSTGITLKYNGADKWWASAKWQDEGLAIDGSVWLHMGTSYAMPIEAAIDTLLKDAANLKLEFVAVLGSPTLYIEKEEDPFVPDDWRETFQAQARRIGWKTYGQKSP